MQVGGDMAWHWRENINPFPANWDGQWGPLPFGSNPTVSLFLISSNLEKQNGGLFISSVAIILH